MPARVSYVKKMSDMVPGLEKAAAVFMVAANDINDIKYINISPPYW